LHPTIDKLAKGKIWKHKEIEEMNVHTLHLKLAHDIDKAKLKATIFKANNDKNIQL